MPTGSAFEALPRERGREALIPLPEANIIQMRGYEVERKAPFQVGYQFYVALYALLASFYNSGTNKYLHYVARSYCQPSVVGA